MTFLSSSFNNGILSFLKKIQQALWKGAANDHFALFSDFISHFVFSCKAQERLKLSDGSRPKDALSVYVWVALGGHQVRSGVGWEALPSPSSKMVNVHHRSPSGTSFSRRIFAQNSWKVHNRFRPLLVFVYFCFVTKTDHPIIQHQKKNDNKKKLAVYISVSCRLNIEHVTWQCCRVMSTWQKKMPSKI